MKKMKSNAENFSEEYETLDDWLKAEGRKLAGVMIYHDGTGGFS